MKVPLPVPEGRRQLCHKKQGIYGPRRLRDQTLLLLYWLLVAAVVQSLSPVQFLATPWTEARQATLSFIISLSLFKLMSIESVMPCNHLILCHPLLLPSIFPSIRLSFLQWVGSSHQVAKVLELQLWHQSFQWIFKVDFL